MSAGSESWGHVLHLVQRPGTPIERVVRPPSWEAALIALRDHPGARPVAGGTDLLLELARAGANPDPGDDAGNGAPVTLVDLSAIAGGRAVTETDDELVLAGGVTHNQVVGDRRFRDHALPLAQACLEVGSPQLRNRATVAGNVATASPANDTISALMALDARIELSSLAGSPADSPTPSPLETREVPVAAFFTGFRATVCRPDELITAIRVPKLTADQRGIWVKLGLRRAQAISVLHLAVVIDLETSRDADGGAGAVITGGRCALGSVAPTVVLSEAFPRALLEAQTTDPADAVFAGPLDESRIAAVAAAVAAEIEPIDDLRATADYRRAVTETLVARALRALRASVDHAEQAGASWPERPPLLVTPSASFEPDSGRGSPSDPKVLDDRSTVHVTVNGTPAEGSGGAGTTLLDWLRDHSSVPCRGVKEGCAEGECGACTVILDGAAVMSCLVPAAQADGADIVTVEGLAARAGHDAARPGHDAATPGAPGSIGPAGWSGSPGPLDPRNPLHPLQEAFVSEFAVQCGFCIPGFLVAGTALLEECPAPSDEQIALGLGGNLCRCTGYYPITQAVHVAARAGSGDGSAQHAGEPR